MPGRSSASLSGPWRRGRWRVLRGLGLAALIAVAVQVAVVPAALACKEDVDNAAAHLAKLKRNAYKVKSSDRLRVLAWLKDSESLLDSARKTCDAAQNFADKAAATAKVAVARASMARADALIPDN